jgi:uncharacterized protein YheU (UPF0270 family)
MISSQNKNNDENMIEIPYQELKPEVLQALIEEFVTRDGADWDQNGCSLLDKVNQVTAQLAKGKIKIVHDLDSASTNLLPIT